MVLGFGRGLGEREAVFRASLPPGTTPLSITGALIRSERFYWSLRGKFKEIPAKIQIKHLGNLERIHRQNLKFIDQADVRGVWIWRAQESARATLPVKCW